MKKTLSKIIALCEQLVATLKIEVDGVMAVLNVGKESNQTLEIQSITNACEKVTEKYDNVQIFMENTLVILKEIEQTNGIESQNKIALRLLDEIGKKVEREELPCKESSAQSIKLRVEIFMSINEITKSLPKPKEPTKKS